MHWNATAFFQALTERNRLAIDNGFVFCQISGLEGLEEALQHPSASNLISISDISDGYISLQGTPHTRSVKTVFMSMRHAVDDMKARASCFDTMRELFRQFMSRLIREKVRLEEHGIVLDSRISFTEIDRYFFTGAACAYFQVAIELATDLQLNPDEWLAGSDSIFSQQFNSSFS